MRGIATAPRSGFETSIGVNGGPAYVALQALDAGGKLLSTSPAARV